VAPAKPLLFISTIHIPNLSLSLVLTLLTFLANHIVRSLHKTRYCCWGKGQHLRCSGDPTGRHLALTRCNRSSTSPRHHKQGRNRFTGRQITLSSSAGSNGACYHHVRAPSKTEDYSIDESRSVPHESPADQKNHSTIEIKVKRELLSLRDTSLLIQISKRCILVLIYYQQNISRLTTFMNRPYPTVLQRLHQSHSQAGPILSSRNGLQIRVQQCVRSRRSLVRVNYQ
jgi:hypothetical protein